MVEFMTEGAPVETETRVEQQDEWLYSATGPFWLCPDTATRVEGWYSYTHTTLRELQRN